MPGLHAAPAWHSWQGSNAFLHSEGDTDYRTARCSLLSMSADACGQPVGGLVWLLGDVQLYVSAAKQHDAFLYTWRCGSAGQTKVVCVFLKPRHSLKL